MRRWGLNGLGSWTTEEFFEAGLYYSDNVEFNQGYPRLEGTGFVDVFDPGWLAFIDRKAREILRSPEGQPKPGRILHGERDRPWSVGAVALDAVGTPILSGVRKSLLQICLAQGEQVPAWREAWRFVLQRHGDFPAAGEAWGLR